MNVIYVDVLLDGSSLIINTDKGKFYYDYSLFAEINNRLGTLYRIVKVKDIEEELNTTITEELMVLTALKEFKSNEFIQKSIDDIIHQKLLLFRKNKFRKLCEE